MEDKCQKGHKEKTKRMAINKKERNKIMIELKNICKSFVLGGEEIKALDNVNFNVKKGEFVSIIGPSGSGKRIYFRRYCYKRCK